MAGDPSPPTANMLIADFSLANGTEERTALELWHIDGIASWPRNASISAAFDPLPVHHNDPHPDPSMVGAICRNISLRKKINKPDGTFGAIVAVWYTSNFKYGSRLTNWRGGREEDSYEWMPIPKLNVLYGDVITQRNIYEDGRWKPSNAFRRPILHRTEARNTTTGSARAIADAIDRNQGKGYVLAGSPIPWLLSGASRVSSTATGQAFVEYRFFSKGLVPAFSTSEPDIDVPVPALNYLEEYIVNLDPDPPTITKRLASWYPMGDTLQLL